ncbi:MAG: septum formation family protein [Acidimicrobiales bacterium]
MVFGVLVGLGVGVNDAASDPALSPPTGPSAAGTEAVDVRNETGTTPMTGQQPTVIQPRVGDCLLLAPGSPDEQLVTVPCAEAHHIEVVGLVDPATVMRDEPTQAEWLALLDVRCGPSLEAHLGKLWDRRGRLKLRVAAPSPSEWRQGDRTGECLVSLRPDAAPAPDAEPATPLVRGSARDLAQAPDYPQGRCLVQSNVVRALPSSISCDGPHHFQVLHPLDLSSRFAHAPEDAQWATLDQECAGAVQARFGPGAVGPSGHPLVGSTIRIAVGSWLAGTRSSGCVIGEVDAATGVLRSRTSALPG